MRGGYKFISDVIYCEQTSANMINNAKQRWSRFARKCAADEKRPSICSFGLHAARISISS
jgi:hypothetical protein